jgi:DNA-binding HxlR family transcriptional regulator
LALIHKLSLRPRRTVELHGRLKGLSTKTLLERLRKLERLGLVSRRSFSESPPRVEYSLTSRGLALLPVVREIARLAELWDDLGHTDRECKACAALNEAVTGERSEMPETTGLNLARLPAAGSNPHRNRKRRDVTLL